MKTLLFLLLMVSPAFADCTITITGPVTCNSGVVVPQPPPVVVVPPVPPPVVDDPSPFVWPQQPAYNPNNPADARYWPMGQGFYAGMCQYTNPLPGSHWYAGRIASGATYLNNGKDDMSGFCLWADRNADSATIRRVLRTAKP